MPRKPVAEACEPEPVEPGFRLGQRAAPFQAGEDETKGDVFTRRLPRQQRVVLKQNADLPWRQSRFHRPGKRLLQPDNGAQQARLARSRWPDQADETTFLDRQIHPFEDRLLAIGNRQSLDAQCQPPAIVVSNRPAMLAPGLTRPPISSACATRMAASMSIVTVSG